MSGSQSSLNIITINAPVILSLTLLSFLILLANMITGGAVNTILMAKAASWRDPMLYLSFFTRVLIHANFSHFFSNFMLILVIGPMMEDKYGGRNILIMLALTALVTSLADALLFSHAITIGASGLVFMFILLASFGNVHNGGIPLTVLLVGFLYIGNELLQSLAQNDNIAQSSHIIGGLCGAIFGFTFRPQR